MELVNIIHLLVEHESFYFPQFRNTTDEIKLHANAYIIIIYY